MPSKVPVKMEAPSKCDDKIVAVVQESADPPGPQQQQQQQQIVVLEEKQQEGQVQSSTTNHKSETTCSTEESSSSSQSSTKTQRTITTKVVTTKTSSSSSTSSTSQVFKGLPTHPADIAFKLQPYEERDGAGEQPTTTTTIREERRVVSEQKVLSELRTKDALTGEDKLLTSAESKSSSARFKKISSNDNLLELDDVEQLQPLTATVSAETRLTERLDNPQDKQSIETGTLTLSECGKQLQLAENGISYTECEETEQQSYLQAEQILGEQPVEDSALEATLQRELSETLTVSRDGEKQVTKRLEQSKETPNKKGAKLLKKTDEERRLEEEAKKLIESYQKVKKEAEKLYKLELADDEQGFDLSAFEQAEPRLETKVAATVVPKQEEQQVRVEQQPAEQQPAEQQPETQPSVELIEPQEIAQPALIEDDLGYVLHKYIIDSPQTEEPNSTGDDKQQSMPKPKPPVPSNKPKLTPAVVKPKSAPPPVPSKRSDPGLVANGKPTPTQRRSSLELTSPVKPTPLERIIVGVEQSPIVHLASVDLPDAKASIASAAASTTANPSANLVEQTVDLLFESHQLPNVSQKQRQVEGQLESRQSNGTALSASSSMTSTTSQSSSSSSVNTPITTPILVSATSSLDSVKSVIEVVNVKGIESANGHDSSTNMVGQVEKEQGQEEEQVQMQDEEQQQVEQLQLVENVLTLTREGTHETGESRADFTWVELDLKLSLLGRHWH